MGHEYRSRGPGSDRSRAVLMRDAALARVGRTRRWVIVGAAALTAGFAALVSALAPGRTLSSAKAASTTGASNATASVGGGSAIPRMPAPASSSDLGLQSPGQAPSPDQSQSQSAPSQPQSAPSQPQSAPSQPQSAPQPAPAPVAPSSSGGGVVSGGS